MLKHELFTHRIPNDNCFIAWTRKIRKLKLTVWQSNFGKVFLSEKLNTKIMLARNHLKKGLQYNNLK